jgi:hypothetical protein
MLERRIEQILGHCLDEDHPPDFCSHGPIKPRAGHYVTCELEAKQLRFIVRGKLVSRLGDLIYDEWGLLTTNANESMFATVSKSRSKDMNTDPAHTWVKELCGANEKQELVHARVGLEKNGQPYLWRERLYAHVAEHTGAHGLVGPSMITHWRKRLEQRKTQAATRATPEFKIQQRQQRKAKMIAAAQDTTDDVTAVHDSTFEAYDRSVSGLASGIEGPPPTKKKKKARKAIWCSGCNELGFHNKTGCAYAGYW